MFCPRHGATENAGVENAGAPTLLHFPLLHFQRSRHTYPEKFMLLHGLYNVQLSVFIVTLSF